MLRLSGVTIDATDPTGSAGFLAAALGYQDRALWGPLTGVKDPAGGGPHLTFQRTAASAPRVHLDLYSDDPDGDVARLTQLGAERLRRVEEGDTWWWVLRGHLARPPGHDPGRG